LEAPSEGYYLFGIACDGAARLYINGKLVIDNAMSHEADKFKSYVLPLAKGFYAVRLEYFQQKGHPALSFAYFKPGEQNPSQTPRELEYSK
jgi:hypothetical protein